SPTYLVQKCRVKSGELDVTSGAVLGCDFQSPWQGCRAAEQLLVEPVAKSPDGLGHQDRMCDSIQHRWEDHLATTRHQVGTKYAKRHGTPDPETALPDLQRIQRLPSRTEIELVIGDHVGEAGGAKP